MGKVAGRVSRDRNNRLRFAYDPAWSDADAVETGDRPVPLSLSMLPGAAEHGHRAIEAFLWGLLPDNATVLDR
jgi:serine/threonine-protein kinase HipA